jgi:O-succinylbenzoate synthase
MRGGPVADLTACYVDYQCPASYRVWRWLTAVGADVEIRPYSLDSEGGLIVSPWDRTTPAWGVELLALGEFARDTGSEAHAQYVRAAFELVHGGDEEIPSPECWLALGAAAGLDLDRFNADSERWRAEVGLWHTEAEDELGVQGVPTLVFDDVHALLVTLEEDVTDAAAGRRLLADLADLADQPVVEVRRTA